MKTRIVVLTVLTIALIGCSVTAMPTAMPMAMPTQVLTSTPTATATLTPTPTPTLMPTKISTSIPTPTPMPIQLSSIELEKAVWAAPELTGGLEFEEGAQAQLYSDVIESFAISPSLRKYWSNLNVSPTLEGVLEYLRENEYFLPGKVGNEELKYLISTRALWNEVSAFSTPNLQKGIYLDGIRVSLIFPWNWKDIRVQNLFYRSSDLRASNKNKLGASLAENFASSDAVGFLVTRDRRILITFIQIEDAKDLVEFSDLDLFSTKVSDKFPEKIPVIVSGQLRAYLDCFSKVQPDVRYYMVSIAGLPKSPNGCGYDGLYPAWSYFKLSPEGLK